MKIKLNWQERLYAQYSAKQIRKASRKVRDVVLAAGKQGMMVEIPSYPGPAPRIWGTSVAGLPACRAAFGIGR